MPQTALTNQHIVGVTNAGPQFAPAVAALPGSAYVIVWLDNNLNAILGQRYDATGQRVGGEFTINNPITSSVLFASVGALDDGGFVVAWQSGSFNNADIHAQRYSGDGTKIGGEFTVNSSLPNEQLDVRVVGLDGGGFLVAWDNIASDTYLDVSGRIFNGNGEPIGPDFTLNTTVIEPQGIVTIAPLQGGGFVATWQSAVAVGHSVIIGQRFGAGGIKVGGEFQVNVDTTHNPVGNDVARLSDGSFVVSWVDPAGTNQGGRIVARHYDASGNALGGEIIIASKASGAFANSTVTALAGGGYIVAWTNNDGTSAGNQVSARAMGGNDQPLDAAFDVSAAAPFASVLYPDGAVTLANGNIVFTWDGPSANTSEDVYYRMYQIGAATPPGDGGPGPDTLNGTSGDDVLNGFGGDDILNGGPGADRMSGGTGNDWYFVDNAGDQVIEAAGEGNDRVFAGVSYTLAAGAEVELMSTDFHAGTAPINLTGNALANYIVGNAGDNILDGAGGADTLVGWAGNDGYFVDNVGDQVVENAGEGTDRVFASISYTLAAGVDVEVLSTNLNAGTAAINLAGNELAQTILGNDGDNILNGGAGADTLIGRLGNDWFFIDTAGDQIVENGGEGTDRVFTGVSYALAAGVGVELMSTDFNVGTAAINLTGNELAQTIYGNDGANILDGGAGADTLVGRAGNDSFAFTTALGAGNVDAIVDFQAGADRIQLDHNMFAGLGLGALDPNAFFAGSAAHDADDRIVYDQASGQLWFDADGSGGNAAMLFATLNGNPVLTASDFVVI